MDKKKIDEASLFVSIELSSHNLTEAERLAALNRAMEIELEKINSFYDIRLKSDAEVAAAIADAFDELADALKKNGEC